MAKHYGPDYEKKRKKQKQRELEREVLYYVKGLNESINWDVLYVHFDQNRTGDIGPVLHDLKEGYYIVVDPQKNVTITDIGLMRLEAGMF
jgi:hypothetical protein